jgi:hypothetical protein
MLRASGNSLLVGENCNVSRISDGRNESEAEVSKPVAQIIAAISEICKIFPELSEISIVLSKEVQLTLPVIVWIFLYRTNSVYWSLYTSNGSSKRISPVINIFPPRSI